MDYGRIRSLDASLQDETLTTLLDSQASTRPDVVAASCGDDAITYRQLAARSRIAGLALARRGVLAGDCVGLFVESSLDMMVATWGILYAGGAYLPLAPEYPSERIRHMIEDSRLRVVLTQGHLKATLEDMALPGIVIVVLDELDTGETGSIAAAPVAGGDLAYVIYTSGTSGKPKGVEISHASITSQMRWLRDVHAIGPGTVVLRKTPMSFDAAQWELLAVAIGSQVVMGEPGVHRDPERLIAQIVQHKVTALQVVPTLLQALVEHPDIGYCVSLLQVFSGGEALSRRLGLRCLEVLPARTLVNLYGPTECTINASSWDVTAAGLADAPNVLAIGKPVAGTTFHVLDEQMRPVEEGNIGELHIGGVQLARGYLHRPELNNEKFIMLSMDGSSTVTRLYRTGDLVRRDCHGDHHFIGRKDNQVKVRGFRIELDEIRLAIENHPWVKSCGVLLKDDPGSGAKALIACVELNPREAALMDQGRHGAHHQSKQGRVQVRAQLANHGLRELSTEQRLASLDLPGAEPTPEQHRQVFARKTYRFFDGIQTTRKDLLEVLGRDLPQARVDGDIANIDLATLGAMLRPFGQFRSDGRLLPKYGYASPGALYATQLYLEASGLAGLEDGIHYYQPVTHQLSLIAAARGSQQARVRLHFVGKRSAIESVYRNNVAEVLEMEAGHMLGLFDQTLPDYGLGIGPAAHSTDLLVRLGLDAGDHHYIGSFEMTATGQREAYGPLDVYLQAHDEKVLDLPAGHYCYEEGALCHLSKDVIQKKHVIAINQQVYERASVGITLVSRNPREWCRYIDLGRRLQSLQMNDLQFGFMSSGYSSKSGNELLTANRMRQILAERGLEGPTYFFLGGRVSEDQILDEGMREDSVHMRGPAELIKKDIASFLPEYMIPSQIVVLEKLPLSANGKIDAKALAESLQLSARSGSGRFVGPRTGTEKALVDIWAKVMEWQDVSVTDDFFERGGDSLLAVMLVHEINSALGLALPLQVIFENSTVEDLAKGIDALGERVSVSRLIALQKHGPGRPIYCWPGLGGYPMSLRSLAAGLPAQRPFFGMQASGLNEGEQIHSTIEEMAAADVLMLRRRQPKGPYTLWGYSFGARVAYEAAYQLEQAGETVESLLLIAPGSPKLPAEIARYGDRGARYDNPAYLTILFSVFAGTISGEALEHCLQQCSSADDFAGFIAEHYPNLDASVVRRIMALVEQTYQFSYAFHELVEKQVRAPVTVIKARGDDYSFIEHNLGQVSSSTRFIELAQNHYGLLRTPGVDSLIEEIAGLALASDAATPPVTPEQQTAREPAMPHVNIKHFPVAMSAEVRQKLLGDVVTALRAAFGCAEAAISISMEPIDAASWNEAVYVPEIQERSHLLCKHPNY